MGSISSPDSDPAASASQQPRENPKSTNNPDSAAKSTPIPTANPPQSDPPAAKSAPPEPPQAHYKVEMSLPADVFAALDETAAELDEESRGPARDRVTTKALTAHLTELGYEFEEAEEDEELKTDESDEVESEPQPKPKGRYRVLEEVTLKTEMLFDIGTEIDSLVSLIEMLDPVMGLIDTAEAMAYPDDDNGRCGLDYLGVWTRKLFGVDLQEEMPKGSKRDSEDVYREAMLIPETVRAAVRHRLERLSTFVGMVQGYEAQ